MHCCWITIAIVATATIVLAKYKPDLQLDMPGSVIYNEGLAGTCVAVNSSISPNVVVNKDFRSNCQIVSKHSMRDRTVFELSNVNGTCVVRCFLFQTLVEDTVTPVMGQEPKIISKPHNTTVHTGMPVSVSCTVENRDLLYHQLLWMKGDAFVGVDEDHSLRLLSRDDSTKTYELTVHGAVETASYTCMLVSTDGKVVSSVTQYISVDEANPEVSDLLKYLVHFFKWYKSD